MEQGMVSIEKEKDADTLYVIYRNTLKRILYQGILIQELISIKKVGNSGVSLQLNAFNEKEKKMSKSIVKIRFVKPEECD